MKKNLSKAILGLIPLKNIKENVLYRFEKPCEGFGDYLVFKKCEDKILCCNAIKEGKDEININPYKNEMQGYVIVDFEQIKEHPVVEFERMLHLAKYFKYSVVWFESDWTLDKIVLEHGNFVLKEHPEDMEKCKDF